jgi:hypothetical protein
MVSLAPLIIPAGHPFFRKVGATYYPTWPPLVMVPLAPLIIPPGHPCYGVTGSTYYPTWASLLMVPLAPLITPPGHPLLWYRWRHLLWQAGKDRVSPVPRIIIGPLLCPALEIWSHHATLVTVGPNQALPKLSWSFPSTRYLPLDHPHILSMELPMCREYIFE